MHVCIMPNLTRPHIRGAILAQTVVHSNDVNYLSGDATVNSSFTLLKTKG